MTTSLGTSVRRTAGSRRRTTTRRASAAAAAPAYSSAAVVSGPSPRPMNAMIGVVTPNARAAPLASITPVAIGDLLRTLVLTRDLHGL